MFERNRFFLKIGTIKLWLCNIPCITLYYMVGWLYLWVSSKDFRSEQVVPLLLLVPSVHCLPMLCLFVAEPLDCCSSDDCYMCCKVDAQRRLQICRPISDFSLQEPWTETNLSCLSELPCKVLKLSSHLLTLFSENCMSCYLITVHFCKQHVVNNKLVYAKQNIILNCH